MYSAGFKKIAKSMKGLEFFVALPLLSSTIQTVKYVMVLEGARRIGSNLTSAITSIRWVYYVGVEKIAKSIKVLEFFLFYYYTNSKIFIVVEGARRIASNLTSVISTIRWRYSAGFEKIAKSMKVLEFIVVLLPVLPIKYFMVLEGARRIGSNVTSAIIPIGWVYSAGFEKIAESMKVLEFFLFCHQFCHANGTLLWC